MCGIIASFGGDVVADTLKQYEKQKSRGKEGFGFLALRDNRIVSFDRATTDKSIKAAMLATADMRPDTILFHHRFPTSTGNYVEAAHPLPITKKGWQHRYYMLHNGVVRGEDEKEIRKDGYRCKSRLEEIKYMRTFSGRVYVEVIDSEVNDSEYLGYYVASYLEGQRTDIPMSGAIACFMLREHKKTGICDVFAMRNYQNPIEVVRTGGKKGKGVHTLQLSSEGKGGVSLESHKIWRIDMDTRVMSEHAVVHVGKDYNPTTYNGYYDGQGYSALPAPKSTATKTAEAIKEFIGFGEKKEGEVSSSEDAIIVSEANRLQLKADAAYDAWQESLAEFGQMGDTEADKYVEELHKEYQDVEAELQALGFVEAQGAMMPFTI